MRNTNPFKKFVSPLKIIRSIDIHQNLITCFLDIIYIIKDLLI